MTELETPMLVRFPSRRSVLAQSRADHGQLTLFIPTDELRSLGSQLHFVATFGDCDRRFELTGKVVFIRQGSPQGYSQRGLLVRFEGQDKRTAAEMFAICAGRSPQLGTMETKRVETKMNCGVRVGHRQYEAQIRDLSARGVFVAAPRIRRVVPGAEIELELSRGFLGIGARKVIAKVVWCGSKNGIEGFGARFRDEAAAEVPALHRALSTG